jgi:hypothetical protein
MALVVGGTVLLPSCLKSVGQASVHLKHLSINADQEALIADICETIIPKTTTPGAKELNLPQFVLKMLDDCYKKKDQVAFMTGMGEFNELIKMKYNNSFSNLSPKERETVLIDLEKSGKPAPDQTKGIKPVSEAGKSLDVVKKKPDVPPLNLFYGTIKQQTLFGYTNSQYFMTKKIVYELVPGRYNAHFPVKNLKAV